MLYKHLKDVTNDEKKEIFSRGEELANVEDKVSVILDEIHNQGDEALKKYTKKFDNAEIENIEVSRQEIDEAFYNVDEAFIKHLENAADNINKYHQSQLPTQKWMEETSPGIELGQKVTPLKNVGAYVPGGSASYPSTALMTIIPAKVAGVENVTVCTPPRYDGTVHPITLASARIAGADHIYRLGGVQAIGALAYGTSSVKKVDKIVGPGNVFVTTAKMLVRNRVEIDFPAGPSEVLIIADESADAKMAASDIVAQLEHDPNAVSILITTSKSIAEKVNQEVLYQAKSTPRNDIIKKSLENVVILIADTVDSCIEFSDEFAPEHLEIMVYDDEYVLDRVENAGSIFVGNYSPVAAGDYASGTNHVLPTSGYAKIYSGLNVNHFIKYSSIQKISKEGLEGIKDTIISISEEEGLYAHSDSVKSRFNE
ncbi:histidinol dehydrogenase [Methanohalobium sp.]|uniref:histidinol dehydrogenase n=1 Tax=Methanohalobium sp. TaxID=2837493 RepID=UPI0025DDB7A7|nr:histidinol dehydrogenase [Methanohalobium sp.]